MKQLISVKMLVVLLLATIAYGQQFQTENSNQLEKRSEQNFHRVERKKGHSINAITTRDGKIEIFDGDLTEVLDVIVEFSEEPLFILKKKNPNSIAKVLSYQNRFVEFSSDLAKIQQATSNRLNVQIAQPKIKREFHKIFFGVNMEATRGALQQIHNLPYVKKIHKNKKVEAFLDDSVPLIGADSVWSQFGTEGDSIVIGIIDTGINYMHPALGGGFGPGFKVIGGYNIIYSNDDPMDDVGHGTHVADIVAADGDSIKGVAPKAFLMAFKVLGHFPASEAHVIVGVTRAMDPNNDGDFSDKVDIANLSLGAEGGTPDDALSTTVDNAVKLGVVVVVAAGNRGESGFNNISTPGTARSAITVGVSDKSDEIAYFSSKGSNAKIHSIKPEIVAPGVNIHSSVLNGAYASYSGTSMSTPIVAGVSALLKAIHSDWSPAQIKSALMTTAVDIGEEVMVQGAGRVDALRAAGINTFAFPAHLSFGIVDTNQIWTTNDTVLIVNQNSTAQDFDISFNGLQTGINLTAQSSNFNLANGDSQKVIMTLTVDNDLVPYPQEGSLTYSGNVFINGDEDQLHLPWAFVKTLNVRLTFDEPFPFFAISGDKRAAYSTMFLGNTTMIDFYTFEFIAPPGIYDLVAMNDIYFSDVAKIIVQENLTVGEGFVDLAVNFTDAIHTIGFNGVDEQGNLLSSKQGVAYRKSAIIVFPDSSFFRNLVVDEIRDGVTLFSSEMSDRFTILSKELLHDLGDREYIYVIRHEPISGVNENISLVNSPADFLMQNLSLKFVSKEPRSNYINLEDLVITYEDGKMSERFGVYSMIPYDVDTDEWNGTLYITPQTHENIRLTVLLFGADDNSGLSADTQPFVVMGDSIGSFQEFSPSPAVHLSPDGGKMSFGGTPIYANAFLINNWFNGSNIASHIGFNFFGALNDVRHGDLFRAHYAIHNDQDNLIDSGLLLDQDMMPPIVDVAPGRYRFDVLDTTFIEGVWGAATLKTKFDLRQEDANPPRLTSLKLLNSEGLPVGRLEKGEQTTLTFSAADFILVRGDISSKWQYQSIATDSSRFYYKEYGSEVWQELALTQVLEDTVTYGRSPIGYLYAADFSGLTNYDSSAIDIKIVVQDQNGNSTEWIQEPAFVVGKFEGVVSGVEQHVNNEGVFPKEFSLHPNYPNPFNPSTVIAFDLPRSEKVTLKIYNILGSEIRTLVKKSVKAGTHKISWDGKNNTGQVLASGVYFYHIKAGNFTATKKMLFVR